MLMLVILRAFIIFKSELKFVMLCETCLLRHFYFFSHEFASSTPAKFFGQVVGTINYLWHNGQVVNSAYAVKREY
jgi:hypothetical protein